MGTTGTFNDGISGLSPGTLYHYRAKAVGNGTTYGSDMTFTTSTTAPTVSTTASSSVTSASATLYGLLSDLGTATSVDVSFQWGLTTSYGYETSAQTYTSPGVFFDTISGLEPGTTYHYRTKAVGSTSYGEDMTFTTLGYIELEGNVWCSSYGSIVNATLDGEVTMVERSHATPGSSLHVVGNLTLHMPGGPDETIELDMYGSRVRSLFYLRQEITGKSVSLSGSWIDANGGNSTYIYTSGVIALPNPDGTALKTSKLCFIILRTPDVEVPCCAEGEGFVGDVESIVTRFTRLIDKLWDSLIGTGFGEMLSSILSQLAVMIAAIRDALGGSYIP
jgi:hypothetical protein